MGNKVVLTFAGDSKNLERAFDRVGGAADRVGRRVERSSDVLDSFADVGAKAGIGFGLSFSEKVGPLVAKAPLSGPLIGAATAAVPAIAAAVSSGLLLALGGGVLAAGIALIAEDAAGQMKGLKQRFFDMDPTGAVDRYVKAQQAMTAASSDEAKKRAAIELRESKKWLDGVQKFNKENFSLRDAAQPFVKPLQQALLTFKKSADALIPSFHRMAQTMAPVLDKLAPAFAEMLERSLPGIEKAVTASVPLFEKLAEHAPAIGEAISKFFDKIAEGAPSAVKFMEIMLDIAESVLPKLGASLNFLTQYFLLMWETWSVILRSIGAFFQWVGNVASSAASWISRSWDKATDRMGKIPHQLRKAFSTVASILTAPFRSAFNAIARAWNNTVGRLSWTVPGWVPGVGGNSISAPRLPTFHKGGIMPGAPGQEGLALLQAGERVTPAGVGATTVIEIRSGGSRLDDLLVDLLRNAVKVRGGNVQLVLGSGRG
jgi:hypothetical protein